MEFTFFNTFKYLFLTEFTTTIILSIISAAFIFVKTGEVRPLLDTTIGKLLSSDEESYNLLTTALSEKELSSLSVITKKTTIDAIRSTVIFNLLISLTVMYGIFSIIQSLLGQSFKENWGSTVIVIGLSIAIYAVIGIVYAGIILYLDNGLEGVETRDTIRFIPFKGTFLSIKNLPFVLGIDEKMLMTAQPHNDIVTQILNNSMNARNQT